ncbi:MAG: hypothetical protein KUG72_13290 [Pseudomonadales bacterium]|nr:hypothetical protein [Pseudomonadales bacterium]
MRFLLSIVGLLLLVSCTTAEIGSSCERKGDSFLARHNCDNQCLAWPVRCGDGTQVAAPNICSGMQECSLNNPCPDQQVCAVSGGNNYCVPLTLCPSGIPTDQPSSDEFQKEIQQKRDNRPTTATPG